MLLCFSYDVNVFQLRAHNALLYNEPMGALCKYKSNHRFVHIFKYVNVSKWIMDNIVYVSDDHIYLLDGWLH